MKKKYWYIRFLIVSVVMIMLNLNIYSDDNNNELLDKKIIELKNFAFCRCMYKEFEKDSIFNNDGTLSAIIEFGSMGFDDYEIVNQYVETYIDTLKVYSFNNSRLGILKCINLYHSEILDSIIMDIIEKNKFEEK